MEVEVFDQQTLDAPAQDARVLGGAAATVPGPNRDTEAALINQTMWQVVHERSKSGATVSAIARELDIDRKTARRSWSSAQRPCSGGPTTWAAWSRGAPRWCPSERDGPDQRYPWPCCRANTACVWAMSSWPWLIWSSFLLIQRLALSDLGNQEMLEGRGDFA